MTLTTAKSKQVSEPVTDVNGNIPTPAPVTQRYISPEFALLINKSIVARPLMTPEVASIRVKNTEYRYRWCNINSFVYTKRKAQGFTNATSDDVDILVGEVTADKGEIRAGDVILMKMQADRYDGAIKANTLEALRRESKRGLYFDENPSTDVFSDDNPKRQTVANEPFSRTKARPYIPDNADEIIADSISSGRVIDARASVKEIRERQEKD